MRAFGAMISVAAFLALVGSFLGAFHPVGDSLAVFRLPLSVIAAVSMLFLPLSRRAKRFGMALCLLGGVTILFLGIYPESGGAAKIYQKNLSFRNADTTAVGADILARNPELVTLQEITDVTLPILRQLEADYPAQHVCEFAAVGGPAVLSRWPEIPDTARCARGMAMMQVRSPSGPVWIVSLHLHWPWPYRQAAQTAELLPVLAELEGPVILGGDFNAVPWSHVLQKFQTATRGKRVGHSVATHHPKKIPLPIDHVLAPGGGSLEKLPLLGSDHHGLLADLNLRSAN